MPLKNSHKLDMMLLAWTGQCQLKMQGEILKIILSDKSPTSGLL